MVDNQQVYPWRNEDLTTLKFIFICWHVPSRGTKEKMKNDRIAISSKTSWATFRSFIVNNFVSSSVKYKRKLGQVKTAYEMIRKFQLQVDGKLAGMHHQTWTWNNYFSHEPHKIAAGRRDCRRCWIMVAEHERSYRQYSCHAAQFHRRSSVGRFDFCWQSECSHFHSSYFTR